MPRSYSRRPAPSAAGLFFGLSLLFLTAIAAPAGEDEELRFAEGLAAYDAGDFETAIEAWQPLAEAGNLEAQVSLADIYMNGLGVAADPGRAVAWYRRAAEAGDPVAQLNLGDFYARGFGVARDPVEAFVWLDLAARQGKRWAAKRRDEIAPQLDAAQRAEARTRIERYRPTE